MANLPRPISKSVSSGRSLGGWRPLETELHSQAPEAGHKMAEFIAELPQIDLQKAKLHSWTPDVDFQKAELHNQTPKVDLQKTEFHDNFQKGELCGCLSLEG